MTNQARSTWSPLRYPLFRALWIASTASHIGSYMTDVGQGWLMSSLTPSPLIVSLLLTAESLPFFLLGLPAGALADIIDRRRLLIVSQFAMLVVAGTLAVVTFTGIATPWVLLALAFALGIATAFNDPAWQAVIPELLSREELAAGITLTAVSVNVARTLGPALGGFIVATTGPATVFVLDGLSFLGVILVLFTWRREPTLSTLPPELTLRIHPDLGCRLIIRSRTHKRPLLARRLIDRDWMIVPFVLARSFPARGRWQPKADGRGGQRRASGVRETRANLPHAA